MNRPDVVRVRPSPQRCSASPHSGCSDVALVGRAVAAYADERFFVLLSVLPLLAQAAAAPARLPGGDHGRELARRGRQAVVGKDGQAEDAKPSKLDASTLGRRRELVNYALCGVRRPPEWLRSGLARCRDARSSPFAALHAEYLWLGVLVGTAHIGVLLLGTTPPPPRRRTPPPRRRPKGGP